MNQILKKSIKQIKEHKSILIIFIIYLLFMSSSSIYFFIIKRIRDAFMCLVFMLIVPAFFVVQNILKVEFGSIFIGLCLFIAVGGILGACYDFYHLIPMFDDILHTVSGFIFSSLGYSVVKSFFGKDDTKRKFIGSIVLGALFSLAIGLIWELFEFGMNVIFGFDMLGDTIIPRFNSYLLSGTHSEYLSINNIFRTIIEYGNNEIYIIEGGYLDLGGLDSMMDMFVCFIGALIFLIITRLSYSFFPKFNKMLLPKLQNE